MPRNKKSRTQKIYSVISAGNKIHQLAQGNPFPAIQTVAENIGSTPNSAPGMAPQRRRIVKKTRRRRRRNRVPPSLRSVVLTIKHIVPYESTSGSAHRWYYQVKKNWLCSSFLKTFAEFKPISLHVRYVPNNSTNETGLYTGVLLDREGFGSYGSATASQWFKTIAAMPGAKVRARYTPTTFRWRPTEPTVRDWIAYNTNTTYCTVYVCNNGKETDELGGLFEVTARIAARGLMYNASVGLYHACRLGAPRPDDSMLEAASSPALSSDFERIELKTGEEDGENKCTVCLTSSM